MVKRISKKIQNKLGFDPTKEWKNATETEREAMITETNDLFDKLRDDIIENFIYEHNIIQDDILLEEKYLFDYRNDVLRGTSSNGDYSIYVLVYLDTDTSQNIVKEDRLKSSSFDLTSNYFNRSYFYLCEKNVFVVWNPNYPVNF